MRRLVLALTAAVSLVASACGDDGGGARSANEGKLQVVASFYPVAEAAQRVGGQQAAVTNLTRAGTEPHDLELTPVQVDQLEDADIVFYLGRGFQPAVEKVAERRDGLTVELLSALPLEKGAAEAEEHAGEEKGSEADHAESVDPHFWLDPTLMQRAVDRMERAFVEARPASREEFRRNAEAYRAELQALDAEYRSALSGCERKELVVSHAAFHYLANRYGLSQEAIAGLSPEVEPNPRRLAELANLVRQRNATTIFYETLVSPGVAHALARDTGAKTAVLNPIEGLTKEQLERGATYASVMRENLAALKSALSCG